jgi:hypothetical protein
MSNIDQARQQPSQDETVVRSRPENWGETCEMPEHLKKFKTHQSIPGFFRQRSVLPPALSVSEDRTVAEQVVNASYERQKKIEQKRATENAI